MTENLWAYATFWMKRLPGPNVENEVVGVSHWECSKPIYKMGTGTEEIQWEKGVRYYKVVSRIMVIKIRELMQLFHCLYC
jgi:hypothetical protein